MANLVTKKSLNYHLSDLEKSVERPNGHLTDFVTLIWHHFW